MITVGIEPNERTISRATYVYEASLIQMVSYEGDPSHLAARRTAYELTVV